MEMTIIPNAFQTPNAYIDRAMPHLTNGELRVLLFATRHILGWQDAIESRCAPISLGMFENGFTTEKGKVYSGCGLGRGAIIKALEFLTWVGLLIKVGTPTRKGQLWKIGEDPLWSRMETRTAELKTRRKSQMTRARSARGQSNNTGVVEQTATGVVEQTATGVVEQHTTKAISKPSPKSAPKSGAGASGEKSKPRNLIYDAVAEFIFGIDPDQTNGSGGRIGAISAWLEGKSDGKKKAVGFISAPAKPEHVEKFAKAYKSKHQGADLPRDLEKFVEHWRSWAGSLKPATSPPTAPPSPPPAPKPTPEEVEQMRRERAEYEAKWHKPIGTKVVGNA